MRIAEAQLVRAIGELEKTAGMSSQELARVVKNFMLRKRLEKRSGKILRALERYEEQVTGGVVRITSAHPLDHSTKEIVSQKAEQLYVSGNTKVKLSFHEDPQLLGGVRFETPDIRYDFSLKQILNQLHKSLRK